MESNTHVHYLMKSRGEYYPAAARVPMDHNEGEHISVAEAYVRLDRIRSLYQRALLLAAKDASLRGSAQGREERLRTISSLDGQLQAAERIYELASEGRHGHLNELEGRAFKDVYALTSFTRDELCEVFNHSSPGTLAQLIEQGQIAAVFSDDAFPSQVYLNEQGLIDLGVRRGELVSTWRFLMHRAGLE